MKVSKRMVRCSRWLLLLCLVMAMAFVLPLGAYARETGKTVRVGWYESPFNSTDQFGRRSGYAYDYQQKIAAYTGWNYDYVEGSWPELMQMLVDGEIDLMSDVSYTADRAELMLFSALPMGAEEYYIFVSPDNEEIDKDDLSTFNGKKAGANQGSVQVGFFREWAEANGVRAEMIEMTEEVDESLAMLNRGDIDMYVVLDGYLDAQLAVPVCKVGASDFYFAVNKARPELLSELNAAMNRIQEEDHNYHQQLYERYLKAFGFNYYLSTEEKNWLSGHGTIRVGYQDDCLSFCAADKKTGELTGALKDYLEEAATCFQNAELSFEPVAYPNAAAAAEALKNGEVDCIFPSTLSTSDGEALELVLTPPVMTSEIYAVARKADQHTLFQKEQITAAVVAGDLNGDSIMKDHFPDWQRKEYPDMSACLKAVADGKADCVPIGNYQYNDLGRQCDRLNLTALATGENVDYYIAIRGGDVDLYSILTRTTDNVSKTNINAALSYYSAEEAKTTLFDFIRDNPAIDVAVIVVVMALLSVIAAQQRIIRAKREVEESHHQVDDLSKQVFVDALTHVRNKAAYAGWEEKINEAIGKGEQEPFAVVVCDVNNLKLVNDQFGHKEGDACIQNACAKICHIFSHSPVFRVGGDEFVVFLSGVDYYQRKELMAQVNTIPKDLSKIRIGETVSAGMAEYRKDHHASLLSVFEEADKAMYERKQFLKSLDLSRNSQPAGNAEPETVSVIHARKTILIADDMESDREIMGNYLREDYNILYASDGAEALAMLRGHKDEIDLVLLDLQMPNKDGLEVIAEMQIDEDLMSIPAVFLTVEQNAELNCLKSGAMDFIPKPYPDIEIVKARIAKCIELSEDRELIRYTERDKLTGLFNKEYFYRYVARLDHLYKDTVMDAIACDVNRFHAANKQYGRQYCDQVLRSIGSGIKKLARETGGIVCRETADTFLLYCPHQDDYEQMFREFLSDVFADAEMAERISMRFGVFTNALQETDIEERFDCAKIAADRVKDDPQKIFELY